MSNSMASSLSTLRASVPASTTAHPHSPTDSRSRQPSPSASSSLSLSTSSSSLSSHPDSYFSFSSVGLQEPENLDEDTNDGSQDDGGFGSSMGKRAGRNFDIFRRRSLGYFRRNTEPNNQRSSSSRITGGENSSPSLDKDMSAGNTPTSGMLPSSGLARSIGPLGTLPATSGSGCGAGSAPQRPSRRGRAYTHSHLHSLSASMSYGNSYSYSRPSMDSTRSNSLSSLLSTIFPPPDPSSRPQTPFTFPNTHNNTTKAPILLKNITARPKSAPSIDLSDDEDYYQEFVSGRVEKRCRTTGMASATGWRESAESRLRDVL